MVEGGLGRERSLAWARLTDLRLLQDIRGRVVPEGEREVSLFWRLNFLRAPGIAARREAKAELHNQIRVAVRSGALSPAEAARTYGVHRSRVYQLLKSV